jgi:plasmid rolling circle replication initiator protein Rep
MSHLNNTTLGYESQVQKTLQKCAIKREFNKPVIEWLYQKQLDEYAYALEDCATVVGFTNIADVAHVTKANFCRKRLCNICAWRRQSRFTAQTFPVIQILKNRGYRFIFASATVPNVPLEDLQRTIDLLMKSYDRLLKHRKLKRAWHGKIRALEVTYNREKQTFHPHIHIMVAVRPEYFNNSSLYITTDEFRDYWEESLQTTFDYPLQVDLRAVDHEERATVETLKYTFKSSKDATALEGFYTALRGRRLVSFSGVFAEVRKELKFSDFEKVLTDDVPENVGKKLTYQLYKFDATGGIYNFWKEYEIDV